MAELQLQNGCGGGGSEKPGLTRGDNSTDVSLPLTADRWIALTHRRKNRQGGIERGGGGKGEQGRGGEESQRKPRG